MTIRYAANLLFFSAKCFQPSSGDGGDTYSLAYRRRMFKRPPQCDLKGRWRAGWCLTGLRSNKGKCRTHFIGHLRRPFGRAAVTYLFFQSTLHNETDASKEEVYFEARGLLPPLQGEGDARRLVIVGPRRPPKSLFRNVLRMRN
jgi:hypothetical protein